MKRLLLTLLPGMLLGIFIGCSGESDTGPAAGSADDPTMGSMGTTPGADEEGSEEAATDEAATDEAATDEAATEEAATEEAATDEAATEEKAAE